MTVGMLRHVIQWNKRNGNDPHETYPLSIEQMELPGVY